MTDPFTGKALDQGVKSLGGLLDRLLGPTFELWGQDMRAAIERKRNAQSVAERAGKKTNLNAEGAIPSRVAAEIFEKAQWAENEFVAEYLSGVLASARTETGENDAGVSWTALVGRLSSDQLALHWIVYSGFQRRFRADPGDDYWGLLKNQVVLTYTELLNLLGWTVLEIPRLYDAAYGLRREGLLEQLSHGGGDYLRDSVVYTQGHEYDVNQAYVTFRLTGDGLGLLMHAIGQGKNWLGTAFTNEASQGIDAMSDLPHCSTMTVMSDFPRVGR
ncbi:MAG: hypothetical protein ACK5LO_00205 [Leucobacter sp.]